MGILRTNTVSGLETPTAVTGSVLFDGTGDYLSTSHSTDLTFGFGNFTIELWINPQIISGKNNIVVGIWDDSFSAPQSWLLYLDTNGNLRFLIDVNSIDTQIFTSPPSVSQNVWSHIAVTRFGSSWYMFINGVLSATGTNSNSMSVGSAPLQVGTNQNLVASNATYSGYISNLRILKGTALYTSNFTPPTKELQPIGDTVLLCCNNPDSAGAEATGKTITVNGNAAASTFSPGLVRDFTYGTQFDGVSKFDTQGYFVPPSGTTEQRGRGRGVYSGGYSAPQYTTRIEYIQIQSQGNTLNFGNLQGTNRGEGTSTSSTTRGIHGGGSPQPSTTVIDYFTIATTSNSVDFGNLSTGRRALCAVSNGSRGVFSGGVSDPAMSDVMDYITISALGNAIDFGNLTQARRNLAPVNSNTRGIFSGGNPGSSPNTDNTIDYITIASTGNAQDFGDATTVVREQGGGSSSTRGIFAGGYVAPARSNVINYVTIASTGNAQDFGDLTNARSYLGICSNKIRAVIAGGAAASTVNLIDYVTIASTGDAQDFGDLTEVKLLYNGACSDSHGGIS